jgi:hypothetical protein
MKIKTNNKPRPVIYGYELSAKEAKDFDYIDPEEMSGHAFFRYRGQIYDLGEFVRICRPGSHGGPFAHYDHTGELSRWDAIRTDSYFSAIVIRLSEDGEELVAGLAFS